jgi:hypothetical protein
MGLGETSLPRELGLGGVGGYVEKRQTLPLCDAGFLEKEWIFGRLAI